MIDFSQIPSPCYVIEDQLLRKNLTLLKYVQEQAGIEIICALKGFSMYSTFPMVRQYLAGATASSLNEARLCFEEMKAKAHVYAPAYLEREFDELVNSLEGDIKVLKLDKKQNLYRAQGLGLSAYRQYARHYH